MLGTGHPVSMYTTKNPIDMWRFSAPQLKEFLTFSVNDRYQLNYFICIKDFNAYIDNTSLKLKLFSIFIYCRQHHERKTFSWRLHITSTYNLPCLRLWYVDVVTVILISYTLEVVCLKFHTLRHEKDGTWTWFETSVFLCTVFPPISVPILFFLFVKRGDNRNLSSASNQKWRHSYRI
jgi:hypothetical protein